MDNLPTHVNYLKPPTYDTAHWFNYAKDIGLIILIAVLMLVAGYVIGIHPKSEIMAGVLTPCLVLGVAAMVRTWMLMSKGRYRDTY